MIICVDYFWFSNGIQLCLSSTKSLKKQTENPNKPPLNNYPLTSKPSNKQFYKQYNHTLLTNFWNSTTTTTFNACNQYGDRRIKERKYRCLKVLVLECVKLIRLFVVLSPRKLWRKFWYFWLGNFSINLGHRAIKM